MLKKVALLFVCLWVPFTQAAPQFKENVNYEVIQPVVSAQPEVMEYFSFFCPHCYRFEPVMEPSFRTCLKHYQSLDSDRLL